MRRVTLFLIILITAIAALIAVTATAYVVLSSQADSNPFSQMLSGMGSMMGQTATAQAAGTTWLPLFDALFAVTVAAVVIGVVGLAYYLLYPQIKVGAASPMAPASSISTQTSQTPSAAAAYESVSKTLTDEERKIITVLQAHNGSYLQKYIKAETGLSRLKTHRIIARLADRGIVTLQKRGNTNQVSLAGWLQTQNAAN